MICVAKLYWSDRENEAYDKNECLSFGGWKLMKETRKRGWAESARWTKKKKEALRFYWKDSLI